MTLIERLEKAASVHYEADNALRMAAARIRELEAAIVKFWDYAKLVLPMPVHPAVGAIMRIGRDLESQSDRQ